ncbi:MAG: choice-of-anchor L domain-containing protein [Myxococcales bacterium]|nr:choice-of-anchor L domain-containing protein [Myxococcales bacterium]
MASARGFVVFASIATLAAACSAGSGSTSNDGNNDGGGTTSGDGGSTSSFNMGGSTASGISGCTDPTCVGSTPQGNCDTGLALEGTPQEAAKAIGICKDYTEGTWGVKSAEWVRSDGQPMTGALLDGRGILDSFGSNVPREGAAMLAISSGAGRAPDDAGWQDPGGYNKDPNPHGSPPGYPKESPSCPGVTTGSPYDSAGLRVVIQTPTDAKSLSFNFNFFTYEYPDYICDVYNDFFVAMMSPTPSGLQDGNISFDTQGNTISVNAGFLDICTPAFTGGKQYSCSQGYGGIPGTGFESNTLNCGDSFFSACSEPTSIPGSAATGWLETKAPIDAPGGEITLHFAVWDSGDGVLDSTTLIDNFKFEADETVTGTAPVPE